MYILKKSNVVKKVKSEATRKRLIEDGFTEVIKQDNKNKDKPKQDNEKQTNK